LDEEKLLRCGAREFANEKRDDVSDNLLLASFLQLVDAAQDGGSSYKLAGFYGHW